MTKDTEHDQLQGNMSEGIQKIIPIYDFLSANLRTRNKAMQT